MLVSPACRILAALFCWIGIMIRFLCFSAVATMLVVSAPAQSQSRRELGERIDATEVRIGELEASFLAGDPVADTLLQRMEALDYQLREMTGEIERLSFENRQLRGQVRSLESDIELLRAPPQPAALTEAEAWMSEGLETRPATAGSPGVAVTNPDDPHAEERAAATGVLGSNLGAVEPTSDPNLIYGQARGRLLDGDFAGAQIGFELFIAEHNDDRRAGEALYWLGETFFVRDDYAAAADSYIASLRKEPEGVKAPDALIRLAASLHGLGRTDDACGTLARFGQQFPNASQASRDRAAREATRANCR
jgi:tol-pal system protein YbgF